MKEIDEKVFYAYTSIVEKSMMRSGWISKRAREFQKVAQAYVDIAKKIMSAVKKEEMDTLLMDIDVEIKENKIEWDKIWNQMP